jgi:signal recognition particle receptor subunit beta
MPVVNPLARELVFKVVYYGPGLGGKTTTLQHIHGATRAEHRGKMVSLATPVDRTLYFDFLPIRVPNVRGMGVRLQLFTVPGQVYYNATRKLVLTGADAVVFVADSQRARLDADLESMENLRDNLREHGRSLDELPFALAYNKRDLDDVVSIEDLEQRLNPGQAPSFATCAMRGDGVFETLDRVARMVLDDFEQRMPESRSALAMESFGFAEGGLIDALRVARGAPSEVPSSDNGAAASPSIRPPEDTPRRSSLTPAAAALQEEALLAAVSGEVAAHEVPQVARAVAGEPALRRVSTPPPAMGSLSSVAVRPPSLRPPSLRPPSLRPPSMRPPGLPDLRPVSVLPPAPPAASAPAHEAAARSVNGHGLSFLAVWPEEDRALAREVEVSLARGDAAAAVLGAGSLVRRSLERMSHPEEGEGVTLTVLALGIDGARYLWLRRSIAEARSGTALSREEALLAYVFALDVSRRCRSRA